MQSIKKAGEKVISTAKKPILVAGTVLALSGSLQSCDNLSPEGQYS
ncbi:hypothetical protein KBC03_00905 [Patescibacteria group bacterium]|nr:hypothetical protein [Patescibacteria group bacterium]